MPKSLSGSCSAGRRFARNAMHTINVKELLENRTGFLFDPGQRKENLDEGETRPAKGPV
jgi:hypothetical protein